MSLFSESGLVRRVFFRYIGWYVLGGGVVTRPKANSHRSLFAATLALFVMVVWRQGLVSVPFWYCTRVPVAQGNLGGRALCVRSR